DVTVTESAGTMTFTVTRTGQSNVPIALTYATADGSATAGTDYTASSGTVTFRSDDRRAENDSSPMLNHYRVNSTDDLRLRLTPPSAAKVNAGDAKSTDIGTMSQDDTNPFAIGDVTVPESAGTMPFTVTRAGKSNVPIALTYATADGSATAGTDYTASSGTVTF